MKNIVFILMDQLRPDYLGCYGATHLKTPNIDKLATESIKYNQAVSPSPLCVPARASMLTGQSSIKNRVVENSSWLRPDHEDLGIITWPKRLSEKGYFTSAVGKMHFYPWDINEGFDKRVIAEDKRHIDIKDDYSDFLIKNGFKRTHGSESPGYYENQGAIVSVLPDELQIDGFVADRASELIKNDCKDEPFTLMVGFPGPHCPYDPTVDMLKGKTLENLPPSKSCTAASDNFRPTNVNSNKMSWNGVDYTNFDIGNKEKIKRNYSALIEKIDEHVGALITTLKEEGKYDDTIIILSSDHGDLLGDYDLIGKHYFYESSIRIPLLIKHPQYEPTQIDSAVSLTDLYNTILHFAEIDEEDSVDSSLLKPFSKGDREPIFGATDLGWMLRENRYKLNIYKNGLTEFYDTDMDSDEQNNLINSIEHKDEIDRMHKILYSRLIDGINENCEENRVMGSNLSPDFFKRNWVRPYPYIG